MWHFVYILRNEEGKQYVGCTTDLNERLKQHNRDSVLSTNGQGPWKTEWFCGFKTKKEALIFEKYLKGGSGTMFRYRHLARKNS